ncbi:MAG: flagellar hook-associated protein FlgL [Desulfonatronovibrionaceae bacterium]
MRVTHQSMFADLLSNLNLGSSRLMELNNQAASQKKINKPSDDPVGTIRVMQYRDSISALEQFKKNVDTGKGWLELADQTLMQGNDLLTRAKAIAEQAATGTLTADQRNGLAYEVEQIFEQLISLSNTTYEGKSIFAGQKVDGNAFERTLNISSNQDIQDEDIVSITGEKGQNFLVQFSDSGTVGTDDIGYRYSADGGKNWTEVASGDPDALSASNTTMNFGGTEVELNNGYEVEASEDTEDSSGTWLWVRPSARYLGDGEDNVQVDKAAVYSAGLDVEAKGDFDSGTVVRIDSLDSGDVEYSYSTDGGSNWSTGHETTTGENKYVLPGGVMEVTAGSIQEGDQFSIRPDKAKIDFQISPDESLPVNNIGKEVFGGVIQDEEGNFEGTVFGRGSEDNVFETLGEFIGYLKTNNQQGIQESLEGLGENIKHISNNLADVGARENRLEVAENSMSSLINNEKERMSNLEDVDIAELMTKLSSQQVAYRAALQSSSRIMQMSLMNYL